MHQSFATTPPYRAGDSRDIAELNCHGTVGRDFFVLICVLRPDKIISLILSRGNRTVGQKQEILKKNHLTTRRQS